MSCMYKIKKETPSCDVSFAWSGKRDSNSRPQPWQGCALPTELFPQISEEEETRTPTGNSHYPLKVARLPIPPPLQLLLCPEQDSNLHASRHTHLKRARLPIPPPGLNCALQPSPGLWSGKRDSNSRPQPWQGCALPTELFPRLRLQR